MEWKPISELPELIDDELIQPTKRNAKPLLVWIADSGRGGKGAAVTGRVTVFPDGDTHWSADNHHGDWNISHWMEIERPTESEAQ